MSKIKLGDRVKDKITGFEGIVTAEINYMYGCHQFQVTPEIDENGNQRKHDWIDEPQLDILKKSNKTKSKPKFGGVRAHP